LQTQLRSFVLCSDWSHTLFEKATAVRKLAHHGTASKRPDTYAMACFKKRWATNRISMPIALS